jgi:hypothetical protein
MNGHRTLPLLIVKLCGADVHPMPGVRPPSRRRAALTSDCPLAESARAQFGGEASGATGMTGEPACLGAKERRRREPAARPGPPRLRRPPLESLNRSGAQSSARGDERAPPDRDPGPGRGGAAANDRRHGISSRRVRAPIDHYQRTKEWTSETCKDTGSVLGGRFRAECDGGGSGPGG